MPESYEDRLKDAILTSRQTGLMTRRTFNRDAFIKEFPQAASDPRFMMLPATFNFNVTPLEELSCSELRSICEKKPDHPLSLLKRAHILGLGDEEIVVVLREELDILRHDVKPTTSAPPVDPPTPKEKTPQTEPLKPQTEPTAERKGGKKTRQT